MVKYEMRKEMANSIMDSLKIDKNPFNANAILEYIHHIKDEDLKAFYGKLFGTNHNFLNGMDRVFKIAKEFGILNKDNLLESSLIWMKVFRKRGLSEFTIASRITEWEDINK